MNSRTLLTRLLKHEYSVAVNDEYSCASGHPWSGVKDEGVVGLYPRVTAEQMSASIDRLAAAAR